MVRGSGHQCFALLHRIMSSHQKIGQKRGRASTNRPRIVLLLDLDCFYAQCETVRLGLDKALPLCLLQWNSALAVNYPARAFGIKRGDGFHEISKKSRSQCVSLHLPVISVEYITASSAAAPAAAAAQDGDGDHHAGNSAAGEEEMAGGGNSDLVRSYNATYNLPAETRAELFRKEKNVMRHPHEGKASLERYRLASARIFSVITEALTANVGKGNYTLERASIDEIFLDVSDHCYNSAVPAWKEDEIDGLADAANKETVVFGSNTKQTIGEYGSNGVGGNDGDDDDEEEVDALRRGCVVARGVRTAVFDALGFTMSAGISINKTVAKLGASYGKPDGQAVVFPELIPKLMEETTIRKCRNMGGKVGKAVLSLLPEDEDRMGSIARLLSINDLAQKLGRETAQRVFNVARGVDKEAVQETKGALTKSITAFKSFGAAYLEGMDKWTRLLATDVVARVEQDSKRNERYPKSCNIQYIFSSGNERTTRNARIPFPKASDREQRLEQLVSKVTDTLAKRDDFPIHRLGLSAIDFEVQSCNGAIDAFFAKQASPKSKKSRGDGDGEDEVGKNTTLKKAVAQSFTNTNEEAPTSKIASPNTEAVSSSHDADLEYARRLQATLNESASAPRSEDFQQPQREPKSSDDPDLEYARRLQASFDTEERMLSALDRSGGGGSKSGRGSSRAGSGCNGGAKGTKRQKPSTSSGLRKNGNGGGSLAAPSSKMKIKNFFSVKKKK